MKALNLEESQEELEEKERENEELRKNRSEEHTLNDFLLICSIENDSTLNISRGVGGWWKIHFFSTAYS